MSEFLQRYLRDQSGATAIEYALIAGGIALVIITAVNTVGTTMNAKFTNMNAVLGA